METTADWFSRVFSALSISTQHHRVNVFTIDTSNISRRLFTCKLTADAEHPLCLINKPVHWVPGSLQHPHIKQHFILTPDVAMFFHSLPVLDHPPIFGARCVTPPFSGLSLPRFHVKGRGPDVTASPHSELLLRIITAGPLYFGAGKRCSLPTPL